MTTRIELSPAVLDDFDRILEHLVTTGGTDGPRRIAFIIEAIDLLRTSPEIGRPVPGGFRDLLIGRRSKGYVARYRYVEVIDMAFVLAVLDRRYRLEDQAR